MFREILTRLAESAADTNEDMQAMAHAPMHMLLWYMNMCWLSDGCVPLQSYVLEIVLTLECALGHLPEDCSQSHTVSPPGLITVPEKRKHSNISPLAGECGDMSLGALDAFLCVSQCPAHVPQCLITSLHVFLSVSLCPACVCQCPSVPCVFLRGQV